MDSNFLLNTYTSITSKNIWIPFLWNLYFIRYSLLPTIQLNDFF